MGHRTVQATVGRGRYQLTEPNTASPRPVPPPKRIAGPAVPPVRTALAAGGVTLAAATVGAPLVAGATGAVLGRKAVRAIAERWQTKDHRKHDRDAELRAIYEQHQDEPTDQESL